MSTVKSPAVTFPSVTDSSPDVTEILPHRGARPPLCVAVQVTSEIVVSATNSSPCFSATSCFSEVWVFVGFPPQDANRMAAPTIVDKKIFFINMFFCQNKTATKIPIFFDVHNTYYSFHLASIRGVTAYFCLD